MREVSSTLFRQADPSGFRKQDLSKRENVLFYRLMLRMCIVEHSLAYYLMASRLNEKKMSNIFICFNKGKGSSIAVPVFGLASTVKFTVGILALLDFYDN